MLNEIPDGRSGMVDSQPSDLKHGNFTLQTMSKIRSDSRWNPMYLHPFIFLLLPRISKLNSDVHSNVIWNEISLIIAKLWRLSSDPFPRELWKSPPGIGSFYHSAIFAAWSNVSRYIGISICKTTWWWIMVSLKDQREAGISRNTQFS